MSGKRLLDAIALFNVSRSVASKHLALRQRQLDQYTRTSSVAKGVQSQTDRVVHTAKAASALAGRFNEPARQDHSTSTKDNASPSSTTTSQTRSPIPSRESVEGSHAADTKKEGLEQDHFYTPSVDNTAVDEVPREDLGVKQEKAGRYALPDGTIPEGGELPAQGNGLGESYNTRPSAEPAKNPLKDNGMHPLSSTRPNLDGPPTSRRPLYPEEAMKQQRQAEFQIPAKAAETPGSDEQDTLSVSQESDVFYRPSPSSPPVLSALPRVKIPKTTEDVQEGDSHVQNDSINSDVFYSSTRDSKQASTSSSSDAMDPNEPSEEAMKDLFHSPRVARLLSKDKPFSKYDLAAKYGKTTPDDNSGLRNNQGKGNISTLTAPSGRSKFVPFPNEGVDEDMGKLGADIAGDVATSATIAEPVVVEPESVTSPYQMVESRVPSSRLGRLWQYGGLATSMAFGAVGESIRRAAGGAENSNGSLVLSAANMDRLVAKLSKMRGAALKLGQMMSIQDSKTLPPAIQEVLQRVQDRADYMPASQRDKVLVNNLGPNWRDLFESFDEIPMAAASIGQVHGAILKSTGERVAVKVQYPGVADSIDSDLNNLSILLTASRLLPRGLYLDKTIANARTELAWECDYFREAECGERLRTLLADDTSTFTIPKVISEASGRHVLTMERLNGIAVTKVQNPTQPQRDWIGTQIFRLCLREIAEFRYMQTDPNWTNFLYNSETNRLELLDFGATRAYPADFIDTYMRLLRSASRVDREECRELSLKLGYLTGFESQTMVNAHVDSILTIAEPFNNESPDIYDFKNQTITDRVRSLIPVMIRERLTPPPEETYSLHRKLSGAFLLCARLGSQVPCKKLFADAFEGMDRMREGKD
ncbi:hypothetical protein FQN54_008571 [Arachnomyces sp. PD_36]|nr:hypothetical protein FQN54_008571 [Arachnomyces sp. PD_36]